MWLFHHGLRVEGGTSAVAPLYAGLLVLIEAIPGYPLGYLNTILNELAGTNVFGHLCFKFDKKINPLFYIIISVIGHLEIDIPVDKDCCTCYTNS
ncbi:MAG: hypothetical protein WAM14_18650 [Candidatus Nitrosopolaris sp.]